jgi:signal transduction histidine kinase
MCARWAWANTSTKMSRNSSRSAFGRFRERAARVPARSFSYADEDASFFRLISTPPRPSETSRPFDAEVRYTCTPFWFFISKRERPPATGRLDRLALLGEMTASMAHEVNQPISGIIMNAGTALRFTAARGPVATAFLFKRARRSWKFAQRQPTFGATNLALLFAKLPQISPCESRIHGFETRADFLAGRFDTRIVNAVRGLSSVGRAPQWH